MAFNLPPQNSFTANSFLLGNQQQQSVDPKTMALLGMVQGLLTPGPYYRAFGPQVGQGVQGGMQGYMGAKNYDLRNRRVGSLEGYREGMVDLGFDKLGFDKDKYSIGLRAAEDERKRYERADTGSAATVGAPNIPPIVPTAAAATSNVPTYRTPTAQSYRADPETRPEGLSDQEVADFTKGVQSLNTYNPPEQPVIGGFETRIAALNNEITREKARGQRMGRGRFTKAETNSNAKVKNLETQRKNLIDQRRSQSTTDPWAVQWDADRDQAYIWEGSATEGWKKTYLSSKEARDLQTRPRAASATNMTQIAQADEAYLKKRLGDKAETVKTYEVAAASARKLKRSFARFRELEGSKGGAFQGGLAPGITGALNFLSTFGVKISRDTLANSQAMQSINTKMLADWMADLGGARGLTETEAMLLAKALPNINQSIEARKQIMEILEAAADRSISEYESIKEQERELYPDIPGLKIDTAPRVGGKSLVTEDEIEQEIRRRGLE